MSDAVVARDEAVEAAWARFWATVPDRHELSAHQAERSRELFEAGWAARSAAMGDGKGKP